jgi:hypothetical protein
LDPYRSLARKDRNRYWASVDTDNLAAEMRRKIQRWYSALNASGRLARWNRVEALYRGEDIDSGSASSRIQEGGESGETLTIRANHLRAIVGQRLTLATGTQPSIHAKGDNSDYRTSAQRKLAEALFAHHQSRGDLDIAAKRALEYSATHGEGYTVQRWDEDAGERYGVEPYMLPADRDAVAEWQRQTAEWEAQPRNAMALAAGIEPEGRPEPPEIQERVRLRYQGDIRYESPHPVDVVRDVDLEDPRKAVWYIVRSRRDRFELAARYPEFEREILDAPMAGDESDSTGIKRLGNETAEAESDLVTVYDLYHAPCHALPFGLRAMMVGDEIVLREQLKYKTLPVHAVVPKVDGCSPFGYAPAFDLIALQQAYDAGLCALLTNMDALQHQKIWVPTGTELEAEDMGGGVRLFKGGTAPPVAIKLLEGVLNNTEWLQFLERQFGMISGMNGVSRGDPESLKAGVALAFQSALAVQAASDDQYAYARHLESLGTALIELYQIHATTDRVIEIAGKAEVSKAKKFTGKDIAEVRRISVDLGNPALRTASGRIDIAEKLLSHPTQPITPKQFLEVMATGRLDPVTEGPDTERGLVEAENEILLSGGHVTASLLDDHRAHVQGHRLPLMDPDMRNDPTQQPVIEAMLAHINEHEQLAVALYQGSPTLAELANLAPLQTVPMMPPGMGPPGPGMPAPGPGMPPGGPMPANDNAGPGAPPAPLPGVDGAVANVGAQRPKLPNLPANTPPELANAPLPAVG